MKDFTKCCTKCKRVMSLDMFYRDKYKKDGLTCWCKQCLKSYRDKHKEYYKQYNKEYYIRKVKNEEKNT